MIAPTFPAGWRSLAVGDLFRIVGGGTPATSVDTYWDGSIPWITSADLQDDLSLRPRRHITDAGVKDSAANVVPAGTVIVATRVGLGKVGLAAGPTAFSQDCHGLIAHQAEVIPRFAAYQMRVLAQAFKSLSRGTTIAGITKNDLVTTRFGLPPLDEQQAIVLRLEQQLTRLAAAKRDLQSAASRLRILRKAILGRALSDGEGTWPVAAVGDITLNRDGQRVPVRRSNRIPGQYPYYGASGVIDHVDGYLFDGTYLLVAEDGANLLSRSSPVAFQATGQFWVNNHAHVLEATPDVELAFLELWLNSIDLTPSITGTAQPKLTQAALRRLTLRLPGVEDQRRIVANVARQLSVSEAADFALGRVSERAHKLETAISRSVLTGRLHAVSVEAS